MKFAALFLFSLALLPTAHAAPPNVIFILTDDVGWGDLGTFFQNERRQAAKPGEPATATPNLDRFAAEGAKLTNHYNAAPVCAPSRASLLSGVSQGHANVRDNQFDKALDDNHNLASVLRTAGYATVAIGKWGLQGGGKSPADWPAYPTKRGFDEFFGYVRHKDGHEHYPKEGPHDGPKEVWDGDREISATLDKCYTADLWTARAKYWIKRHEKAGRAKPFFMYLAYDTPHAATELPTGPYPAGGMRWLGKPGHMISSAEGKIDSWIHPDYRDATWDDDKNTATPEKPWPNVYKRYATSVRRIDDAVGDLVKLLQDLKIDDNTLIVFASDNGPSIESYLPGKPLRADFFNSFGPFDGIKRDCWEGGLRSPTIARWPGHIPAGKTIATPSASYDWLRTFAEAAGVPAPARADGVSLLPELIGGKAPKNPDPVYVEYFEHEKTPGYKDFAPAHRNRRRGQMQAIRMGDFAGVRYDIKSEADPFEIYKVTEDPQETRDLAADMPDFQQRLKDYALQSRRPNASAPRPYDDELVPAIGKIETAPGVVWKSFQGKFPWVPDFDTLKPAAAGVSPAISAHDGDGALFSGYLGIPTDGTYEFSLAAGSRAVLRIHNATVIDADRGGQTSGSIRLKAALHPFRLHYLGSAKLDFSWSGPGIGKEVVPATALRHAAER